ncbi:MAG: Gfo/Idh/MocA family oxidoreductase [Bacteroidota bacterium]|nr:Gfo/Idh/MocA family oxidoreductase [Bacteroidota bacterium]
MDRRAFVRNAVLAAAVGPFIRTVPRTQRYRTVLIGSGWWGMNILRTALASATIDPVALCDVDTTHLEGAAEEVKALTGTRPHIYKEYEEALSREGCDIAIVATPDHWHALPTIAALETGAHVYLEKPISHTIDEGKAMLQAARQTNRIVQVGTHRRVSPHNLSARDFFKSGRLGDIGSVRAFVHYGGGPGQITPDSDIPEGLDWDRWVGPAPYRPFNSSIHPRGFRQYLDFANGQLGDWGIHWLDQILWFMDEEPFPHTISSVGARHIRKDSSDAPDTQVATFAFEKYTATWEHRLYGGNNAEKSNIGCYFYGTKGTLHLGWLDGWTFYPSDDREPVTHEDPQLDQPDSQNISALWDDFIHSIESSSLPACDIEYGYRATNMCLAAMLSLRIGRSIQWDSNQDTIIGDPAAQALMRRPYREPWIYPET